MHAPVHLSIVTSLFRSAPYLDEFCRRSLEAAARLTGSFELVLVNDGSPDDSLAMALRLRQRDTRIRVIDLSRNFGHYKALMTGLAHARGDLVFLIDCDLEEQPEWLGRFHDSLLQTGADVAYGVQRSRKGGWWERISGVLFYQVLNRMLTHPIPENVVTVRLMTRRYVRALVQHRDREISLAALWVITGFAQEPIVVDKGSREQPSYRLRQRLSSLISAITSFSNRPLIYVFYIGVLMMILSCAAALALIVRAFQHGIGVPGYASVMVSIWFLGGLTIFSIGIVGVYVAKVFTEVKDRPYTIIRAEYDGDEPLKDDSASSRSESAALSG
jgi:putative glycosyltransferase